MKNNLFNKKNAAIEIYWAVFKKGNTMPCIDDVVDGTLSYCSKCKNNYRESYYIYYIDQKNVCSICYYACKEKERKEILSIDEINSLKERC